MADTLKRVSINDTAATSLRSMLVQLKQVEGQVQAYIRGLRDSLGLEGEDWQLDMANMTFVRDEAQPLATASVNGKETHG